MTRDRRRATLAATILGSSVAFLDTMIVVIALPSIADDLGMGLAGQQWVLLAYSLTLVALYLVAGAVGDRRGHRRVFTAGAVGFAAASVLAGLAPSAAVLIAARALQGVAGAFLTTNSLALLRQTYGPESGRAIGLWTAFTSLATLVGPPLGGAITQWASWRWIFFLNLPLAVAAVVLARSPGGEPVPDGGRAIDVRGAVTGAAGVALVTYGIVEGAEQGVAAVWWAFAAGGTALVAFWLVERRAADPILPLRLFRRRNFAAVNATTLVVYGAISGIFVYLTLYLQFLGFSPLQTGLAELPVDIAMLVLGARFGTLAGRRGPKPYLVAAPLMLAAAALTFLALGDRSDFWVAGIVGILLLSLGLAVLVAPITNAALTAAPAEETGTAAGVNSTLGRLGGLLAVAILGLVASLVYQASASHGAPLEVGQTDPALREASVDAFRAAMLVAAGLGILGAAVAGFGISNPEAIRAGRAEPPGERAG